jgi:hypothetical protein
MSVLVSHPSLCARAIQGLPQLGWYSLGFCVYFILGQGKLLSVFFLLDILPLFASSKPVFS